MKRIYTLVFALLMIGSGAYGQGRALLGQYFQNLPAFSPALTGANDYLDIKTGFRKQWAGFDGAPTTGYISAYSPLRIKANEFKQNSLRGSTNSKYWKGGATDKPRVRLGIGGYVLVDDRGPFQETEAMLNFAVHVPISTKTYLSLGTSAGISNAKVDLADITVVDNINDQTFLSFVNNGNSNNFLNVNAGIAVHSDGFYLSYSAMQLAKSLLSGNEEVNNDGASLRHHILGGYRFFLNDKWELIPNTFIRIDESQPFFFEAGARFRYNKNVWFGASYRNDESAVGMLGFAFNDVINFGYSYEFKSSDFNNFNNSSHELVLGFRLFNYSKFTSIW